MGRKKTPRIIGKRRHDHSYKSVIPHWLRTIPKGYKAIMAARRPSPTPAEEAR